jgi:hypothetical protein
MPESLKLKPTHLATHHYNRSKPRELLAIQQGGVIGIVSERVKGTRYMIALQTILQKAR